MASSDAHFGYRAKLKREDHDLSRPFGFTTSCGMLNPIFADIATPGDAYYIKHDLTFLRTAPLAAPAMIDVKVHYETFFVPFQMIYQPFENVIFSLKNLQSSLYVPANLQNTNFPLFNYSAFVTNIITNAQNSMQHQDSFRLADLLDLNAENFCRDDRTASAILPRYQYEPNFFPWQILAYNTIYQYYFRLDDKSQFYHDNANWDLFYSNNTAHTPYSNFMQIHQRPWKFDYFTSVYHSAIVSPYNTQEILPAANYSNLVNSYTNKINAAGFDQSSNGSVHTFTGASSSSYDQTVLKAGFSTAAIRQMFANEKLAMITGRTKKTYDSQVLAHYGIEVPHDVKHDLTLIAHDTYKLHVGEVTSLSATSDASLGDLAGKGWAQSPDDVKQHKFVAPCHGVIMTLFSVEPEQRYYGGFNRINAITNAFDVPTPEFDRLGNMPMFRYEAGTKISGMTDNDIIGWKERYYFNKRRSPKTTCAFMNPIRSYRGVNSYSAYMITNFPFDTGGSLLVGVGRPDLEGAYYINRNAMDSLMLQPYYLGWYDGYQSGSYDANAENWNRSPWLVYARDPFIVDSFEKVKKISWMSKDGEPIYDF